MQSRSTADGGSSDVRVFGFGRRSLLAAGIHIFSLFSSKRFHGTYNINPPIWQSAIQFAENRRESMYISAPTTEENRLVHGSPKTRFGIPSMALNRAMPRSTCERSRLINVSVFFAASSLRAITFDRGETWREHNTFN